MLKCILIEKISRLRLNFIYLLLMSVFLMMSSPQAASAANADIGWNASSGSVAGYNVYYGTSSGNYTTTLNVGNATTATLQNLSSPVYYITVAAYSASSYMSPLSSPLVIYALNASAGAGGAISSSGTSFQSSGGSKTFTITPASGYIISDVKVDGNSVGPVLSYTFSKIAAGHTISATFLPAMALWQSATDMGGGWQSLPWFGSFNISSSPWIYHSTLGWLYPLGTSTDSIWFGDPQWDGHGGWWWTGSSTYPWIYSNAQHAWLYFDAAASTPTSRLFWNSSTKKWEKH